MNRRDGVDAEVREPLEPRELGVVDPAGAASFGAVIDLGGEDLGEVGQVSLAFPGGDLGQASGFGADGRQMQLTARCTDGGLRGRVDRRRLRCRGGGHVPLPVNRSSLWVRVGAGRSHHLVFADPDNAEARNLQADAYEQLGYQQEIPQWRGIFLTAAMELRQGVHTEGAFSSISPDIILNMPTELLFDFAAVHVVADRAADVNVRINVTITGGDAASSGRCGLPTASSTRGRRTPMTSNCPSPGRSRPSSGC